MRRLPLFRQVVAFGGKRALDLRDGPAGDELGLLVDEPETMQQVRHAAGVIGGPASHFDPRRDALGRNP